MQISATEVAKLLSKQQAKTRGIGDPDLVFKEISLEELPDTKVADPSPDEVARYAEMVKAMPDVREDIVMKLKERVEKGEYEASGEEISEMMVRRMQADQIR